MLLIINSMFEHTISCKSDIICRCALIVMCDYISNNNDCTKNTSQMTSLANPNNNNEPKRNSNKHHHSFVHKSKKITKTTSWVVVILISMIGTQ